MRHRARDLRVVPSGLGVWVEVARVPKAAARLSEVEGPHLVHAQDAQPASRRVDMHVGGQRRGRASLKDDLAALCTAACLEDRVEQLDLAREVGPRQVGLSRRIEVPIRPHPDPARVIVGQVGVARVGPRGSVETGRMLGPEPQLTVRGAAQGPGAVLVDLHVQVGTVGRMPVAVIDLR